MTSTPPPLRVAVVGGGIAGLVAALALQKRIDEGAKLQLTVFEQASKFGEIGAGVSLGPNAQRVLRALGLGDELAAVAAPPGKDGDLWFEYRVGQKGEREGEAFAHVSCDSAECACGTEETDLSR